MPAKPKKLAKKKPSTKSLPAKAKRIVEKEYSDVPNLRPPEVAKHLAEVEALIKQSDKQSGMKKVHALIKPIEDYAMHAAKFSHKAVQAGASALVFAWACGKLLNATKKELGHDAFGDWRADRLLSENLSERTSQRYMKLAKQCPDIKVLLEWNPSLRQAYIACGVLPEPEQSDNDSSTPPQKAHVLLASLSGLQKNLRLFAGSNEKLGKEDISQLKLVRDELYRFFDQVIPTGK